MSDDFIRLKDFKEELEKFNASHVEAGTPLYKPGDGAKREDFEAMGLKFDTLTVMTVHGIRYRYRIPGYKGDEKGAKRGIPVAWYQMQFLTVVLHFVVIALFPLLVFFIVPIGVQDEFVRTTAVEPAQVS